MYKNQICVCKHTLEPIHTHTHTLARLIDAAHVAVLAERRQIFVRFVALGALVYATALPARMVVVVAQQRIVAAAIAAVHLVAGSCHGCRRVRRAAAANAMVGGSVVRSTVVAAAFIENGGRCPQVLGVQVGLVLGRIVHGRLVSAERILGRMKAVAVVVRVVDAVAG